MQTWSQCPRKGIDLQHCDNWRGISLLDVVGKLFARVIQERLQVIDGREGAAGVAMWVQKGKRVL